MNILKSIFHKNVDHDKHMLPTILDILNFKVIKIVLLTIHFFPQYENLIPLRVIFKCWDFDNNSV